MKFSNRAMLRSRWAVTTAILSGMVPSMACAQAAPAPAASAPDAAAVGASTPATSPSSAAPADVANLGDIVVTAQRRSERLHDVPVTISAISGDQLANRGIISTRDLGEVTPGLFMTQSSFSPQPTIRGLGTHGVTAGDESVVPVYIDGVYQPVLTSTIMDLNSVERVEVLKGPQGTLFGRNATGGAINIITRTPREEPGMDASLSYGRFDDVVGQFYATAGTGPLSADFAALYHDDNGYIRDIATDQEVGDTHNISLRGKVRYQPSSIFDATLSYSHVYMRDSISSAAQPLNGNTNARRFDPTVELPSGPFETTATDRAPFTQKQDSGALNMALHLNGVDITSITGLSSYDASGYFDSDLTPYVSAQNKVDDLYSNALTQDLYAATTGTGPFKVIAGATYYGQSAGYADFYYNLKSLATNAFSLTDVTSRVVTHSIAFYAQGSYDLTGNLNLTAGGRYTHDSKHFHIRNNVTGGIIDSQHTWEKFTPTGTLQYKISPNANVYVKVGQAFKAGIYASQSFSPNPVNPETATQYEVGAKFNGPSGFSLNIAGYYTNYKDMQVNTRDPVTLVSTLQNAASAEIYGIDGDLTYSPVHRLNLHAGLSLLHAQYRNYKNAQVTVPTGLGGNNSATIDASGNDLLRVPFVTGNSGFDYTFDTGPSSVRITTNVYYNGKSYYEASNRLEEKSYVIGNGEIAWLSPNRHYELSVWGDNIFNAHYRLYVLDSTVADAQVYAKPATYGVRLKLHFM